MPVRTKKVTLKPKDAPWDPSELHKWRVDHDLSQIEAAAALGFPLRSIENWEQGIRKPDYPVAVRNLMKWYRPSKR